MCSIYGFVGRKGSPLIDKLSLIGERARDRGRDAQGESMTDFGNGFVAHVGNCRATPTTEKENGVSQPYEGIVHNGTIANDKELGNKQNEIDSTVLPKVLDRTSLKDFNQSIRKLKGSYAIACVSEECKTIFLARNYKPIHYWSPDGESFLFSSMKRHFNDIMPRGQSPVEMAPYRVMDLLSGHSIVLPRKITNRAIVVASSGLDSTTAIAMLKEKGYEVRLLHFRYKCQAESREVDAIKAIAEVMKCDATFIDLPAWNSPLITPGAKIATAIEGAEYAHEWVPARNLFFVSAAVAYAEAHGFDTVAIGANLEEAGAYPDNEEQMFELLNDALHYSVQEGCRVRLVTPVGNLMKHEIVKEGLRLGVPYHLTWSCYKGGEKPCGDCGPCFMREEAFKRNGTTDPLTRGR